MKNWFTNLLLIAVLAISGSLSAQTVIAEWDFDGDAQGWTSNSIVGDSTWAWSPTGDVGNGLFAAAGTAIMSPSGSNGAMTFNSDFYTTGGTTAPTTGPPYTQYVCELISPTIDLSAVTGVVGLRFAQLARPLNLATGGTFRTAFQVSSDDGVTWTEPVDCNPNVAPNDPPANSFEVFPVCGSGIEGSATARIKFTFAMDFYFWVIDDVQLIENNDLDVRSNANFFSIAPNAQTPKTQVGPVWFMNDIENVGGANATNTSLNITVNNATSGAQAFSADRSYGDVPFCSLRQNEFFDETFTPAAEVARYDARYSISADGNDVNPDNNFNDFSFEVTENIFAKDFGFDNWRSVRPAADQSFTWGCYYRVNADGDKAKSVMFDLSETTAPALGAAGRSLTVWLYEWTDENQDQISQESERVIKALSIYDIQGTESWQADDGLISIDLEAFNGPDDLNLEAGKGYIVALQYDDDPANPVALDMAGQQGIDYAAMAFQTDSLGDGHFSQFLDVGNTGEFSPVGFGYNLAPVAYLSIEPINTSVDDLTELDDNVLNVFPNPASFVMNVDVDFAQAENVTVQLLSLDGKIIFTEQHDNVTNQTFNYNVSNIVNGSYNVRIMTETGYKTKTVNVQH